MSNPDQHHHNYHQLQLQNQNQHQQHQLPGGGVPDGLALGGVDGEALALLLLLVDRRQAPALQLRLGSSKYKLEMKNLT